MSKPLYQKLVAKSEREASKYSKLLAVSLRAIAKEIAKELHLKVKHISPMSNSIDNKRVFVNVDLHESPELAMFTEIQKRLDKHKRFAQVTINSNGTGFGVAMYPIRPYTLKE